MRWGITEEKTAAREILMEGMLIALSSIAIIYLFGFSGDDEDRFAKIKGREDKLVYRSVKYDPLIPVLEEKHMYIEDKHYEKKYYVKKMA